MQRPLTCLRLVCSSILLLLAVSPALQGQAAPAASAEQIQALQKRLDALQSQMTEVQGELQRLSGGAPAPTHETTDIVSAVIAEQQNEKVPARSGSDSQASRTRQDHQDLHRIFARPICGAAHQ